MATEQKISGSLPIFYGRPESQICEIGDSDVKFGGINYYVVTTVGDIKESGLDWPLTYKSAIQHTVEIWGSRTRHLRAAEKIVLDMVIEKEIDVDSLIMAMDATDEEVKEWLALLLEDYDVKAIEDNIEDMSQLIRWWIGKEASKRSVRLEEDEASKIFRFAVRLAYEALYVGYA